MTITAITIQPPVWAFDEDSTPCSCCWATNAIEGDKWICNETNKQWLITDPHASHDPHTLHSWYECKGNCPNPLHNDSNLILAQASMRGIGWGDILQIWEDEELAKLSEAEKNAMKQKQEEELAKEEAMYKIDKERRRIEDSVRRHEIVANYKGNKGRKEMRPCRYLYSCNGDRKTGGARPSTLHITTECWNYEYHDPITKKLVISHTCMHLHPGEEGWCKEWETNRLFVPSGAQQQQPQQQQHQSTRFSRPHSSYPPHTSQRPNQPPHRAFHNNNNKETRYNTQTRTPVNFRTLPPAPQPKKQNTIFDALNDSDSD
jgi:hypothetical protein